MINIIISSSIKKEIAAQTITPIWLCGQQVPGENTLFTRVFIPFIVF
jgi:hypothetical protein